MKWNIPVVTPSYIDECLAENKKLESARFSLKPLEGLNIFILSDDTGVYGALQNNFRSLVSAIEGCGGRIALSILDCDYKVLPNSVSIDVNGEFIQKNINSIFTENWIFEIKLAKAFIDPTKAGNFSVLNINLSKLKSDLMAEYYDCDLDELTHIQFFKDFNFKLDESLSQDYQELLRYCICLGGGFYFYGYNPFITHVITFNKNYSIISNVLGKVLIATPNYIINSIRDKKHYSHMDFIPFSALEIINTSNSNSTLLDNYDSSRGPISFLFKDLKFYFWIETYSNKLSELKEYAKAVKMNGGEVIEDKELKTQANYVVINDGFSEMAAEFLGEKKNYSCLVVSHRFISFCITKKKCVDLRLEKFYHAYPLPKEVPYESFKDVKVSFKKFDIKETQSLEYLSEALGASIAADNDITHIICKDNTYATEIKQRIQQSRRMQAKNIQVVLLKWLTDSLFMGQKAQEKDYLI